MSRVKKCFVARSYSDLAKAFRKSKSTCFLYVLPETCEKSCDQDFLVTKELYEYISKMIYEKKLEKLILNDYMSKELYTVKLDDFNQAGDYPSLIISKVDNNCIVVI